MSSLALKKNTKHWGCPSLLWAKCKYIRVFFSQNKALHRFPLTKFQAGVETDRPQRPPSLPCWEQPEAPRHFKTCMATSVRHQDLCCLLYLFLHTTHKFYYKCSTISADASWNPADTTLCEEMQHLTLLPPPPHLLRWEEMLVQEASCHKLGRSLSLQVKKASHHHIQRLEMKTAWKCRSDTANSPFTRSWDVVSK